MERTRPKLIGSNAGFSLTEVLMAVFIISLASTFVIIAGPKPDSPLETQAKAIVQVLDDASEHAMISGLPVGFEIDGESYSTLLWNGSEWKTSTQTTKMKPGVRSDRQKSLLSAQGEAPAVPTVIFDPTGLAEGKAVLLSDGRTKIAIVIEQDGSTNLERDDVERFR